MLTAPQRAVLAKVGISSDLRVRCWFTLVGQKAAGQWEDGIVTRVDDEAFFVSYPDAEGEFQEWPVGVRLACAPTGKTWRPGWVSRMDPCSTPEKKKPRQQQNRRSPADLKLKELRQEAPPPQVTAQRARARPMQRREKFEKSDPTTDFQMRRRRRAQESGQKPSAEDGRDEQWLDAGSEWVGERVLRVFSSSGPVEGRVIKWLPQGSESDEPALYKVEHTDGDLEDLEEHEIREGRDLYREKQQQERWASKAEKTDGLSKPVPAGTLSPSMRARLQWFDACQDKAALNIAKGDPQRGFLPYLKPGNALWNESMRLFYAAGGEAAQTKSDGHIFGEVPGGACRSAVIARLSESRHLRVRLRLLLAVPEGTLVISRSRLMVLNLHRPIMAGIDYCSRRNRHGKMEPWAVTSIIESGGYEDDEDEGDVLWYTGNDCQHTIGGLFPGCDLFFVKQMLHCAGQGANDLQGDRKQTDSQKLVRGNLAFAKMLERRERGIEVSPGTLPTCQLCASQRSMYMQHTRARAHTLSLRAHTCCFGLTTYETYR